MKKTAQTLLTAAIFATALGSAVPSQFRQPVQAVDEPIAEVETELAGIYGPPSMFTETTAEPEITTDYTDVTEIIPQPTYGPPRTAFPGDANFDGIADVRDLTLIKRAAQFGAETVGYFEFETADVNSDGTVDKEDVRIFMEETLGIPKKEEPAATTTVTAGTDEIISSLETTTETAVVLLYGPPPV